MLFQDMQNPVKLTIDKQNKITIEPQTNSSATLTSNEKQNIEKSISDSIKAINLAVLGQEISDNYSNETSTEKEDNNEKPSEEITFEWKQQ